MRAELLFWASLLLVSYAYAGYPLFLALIAAVRRRLVQRAPLLPEITVIVPVHSQREEIRRKIENLLSLDYPSEKVRIVISSDGSTDGTDRVVEEYAPRGVILLRSDKREGKVAAQNRALEEARGEIVVFTDASILLSRGALRAIVRPFADQSVGCVSSEDDVPAGGEGMYVRYEMALRRLEASVSTMVGVSGSFYAVRRELCEPTPTRYTRDFLVPLDVIRRGYRVVSEPAARGRFLPAPTPASEFRRKTRTVMRGMDVLWYRRGLLHPFRRPFVAWALLSHKIFRWLVPPALVMAYGLSGILAGRGLYLALFLLQTALYLFPFVSWPVPSLRDSLLSKAIRFFLTTNAAVAAAWFRFLRGERAIVWEPTKR
jgi:cellulose synthase/poly-beta-1,6-N-acetylglucosamine synthase-like glycosyltransferase